MRSFGIPHTALQEHMSSSCSQQVIHNTTILKDNIQRQICIGNASFVDLGLETEQVTIAAGMAAASGSCRTSACSEFSITWC